MKFSDSASIHGDSFASEISFRLSSVHSKSIRRRESAFDSLIKKYDKPNKSAVIDIRNFEVIDAPEENGFNDVSRAKSINMEITKEEKEELSALFKLVQSGKVDTGESNRSSKRGESSSVKSIQIRRKKIIERRQSHVLSPKITSKKKEATECKPKTFTKRIQSARLLKLSQQSSASHSENTNAGNQKSSKQKEKTSQKPQGRVILKQITIQRNISVTREANTDSESTRPVRQCRLNSKRIMLEGSDEEDSDNDDTENFSPNHVRLKKARKKLVSSTVSSRVKSTLVVHKQSNSPQNKQPLPAPSVLSSSLKKCTCLTNVSRRTQPRRSCKKRARDSCAYCNHKAALENYKDKFSLKDCSVVIMRLEDMPTKEILENNNLRTFEPILSRKAVNPRCNKTALENCKDKLLSKGRSLAITRLNDVPINEILENDNPETSKPNLNRKTLKVVCETKSTFSRTQSFQQDATINNTSSENILSKTSGVRLNVQSLASTNTTKLTLSRSYAQSSHVSFISSKDRSSILNGNFSFLNRNSSFVTLPSSQPSSLISANLSMTIPSKTSLVKKLFSVRKWLRQG